MTEGRFQRLELDPPRESVETREGIPARDHRFHLDRARNNHRAGRFEQALQDYTRCLEHERTVIPAWVGQVRMLVELGEHAEARLWSDKALELFRDNPELLAAKAQACARLGDLETAFQCSDAALHAPKTSAWRWISRGEVVLASSRADEATFRRAAVCFRKALAEEGTDWFDRLTIGRILVYHHRLSDALPFLRKAARDAGESSFAWLELGRCQEALGMKAEARTSYTECLALQGHRDEARAALEGLERKGILDRLRRMIGRKY